MIDCVRGDKVQVSNIRHSPLESVLTLGAKEVHVVLKLQLHDVVFVNGVTRRWRADHVAEQREACER